MEPKWWNNRAFQIGGVTFLIVLLAGTFIGFAAQLANHPQGGLIGSLIGAAAGLIIGGIASTVSTWEE